MEPAPGEVDLADNVVWAYVGTEQGIVKVPDYYPTIQEAVDSAAPGDIVQVSAGTYNEAVYVPYYQHNLSLVGDSRETTVINGSSPIWGIWPVHTDADNFRISGFTLQNSGCYERDGWVLQEYAGIFLYLANNCTITDNAIHDNHYAIVFMSYGNTITGNRIFSSEYVGIIGVEQNTRCTTISGNSVESSGIGIVLAAFNGASGRSTITNNLVKGNDEGIELWDDALVLVEGNRIIENTIAGITFCVWETGNVFRANHVRDNGVAISFQYGATDNAIYWNNFVNNTIELSDIPNIWHGAWNVTGNYWSDYTGQNRDKDKYEIGDDPYIIDNHNRDNFPFMKPYLPGDVKHDGKVDIFDLVIVSMAYGTHGPPNPSPKWDPHADLNEDNKVDNLDLAIVSANYGKTWQNYWGE
jgi:parallel beta-helix repeat protein